MAYHLDRAGLVGTLNSRDGEESPRIGKRRLEAVQRVDVRVRELAAVNPSRQGTGTTLTALIARPSDSVVMIAHLGDGRAYAHEHGRCRRLTRDHTWAAQQLAAGRLTPEQARQHRFPHFLTHAAGVGSRSGPTLVECVVDTRQVYLLCTDGLTNMLADLELECTLTDVLPDG
ncbi:MAG: protein phosphatase 2C domain-containing protein [Gemmatimonadota bacterium]|nr:protein phosphatase 2C domain-containing protein [Gemmatimonadota bacterium]